MRVLILSVWVAMFGVAIGCTTNKPQLDGPVHYECDLTVVRIIPDPKAPAASPFNIPMNPCGFKI